MTQQTKRRPRPITQRDGTTLQNSNCRMASVSTGLDFHTVGARTSTAGKMRSYTSDQSGGTGSDDAKEAWTRGFKQNLIIKDGGAWASVMVALREGRGVNLDVWHALLFSGCISGTGRYGHNIYVHPDEDTSGKWLVSDPWCKPGKWDRISAAELRAAAEEWGRRVRSQTGAREPALPLLRAAALALMRLWQPEREMPVGDPTDTGGDPETGGYLPIMFTTTNRQPLVSSGKETDGMDKLMGTPGMFRVFKVGTPHFSKPGGAEEGTIKSSEIVYSVVAQYTDSAGKKWFLINGGSDGNMGWVRDADMA